MALVERVGQSLKSRALPNAKLQRPTRNPYQWFFSRSICVGRRMSRADRRHQSTNRSVMDDAQYVAMTLDTLRILLLHVVPLEGKHAETSATERAKHLSEAAQELRALAAVPHSRDELTASLHNSIQLAKSTILLIEPRANPTALPRLINVVRFVPLQIARAFTGKSPIAHAEAARSAIAHLDWIQKHPAQRLSTSSSRRSESTEGAETQFRPTSPESNS
jgi:hypothetical protein